LHTPASGNRFVIGITCVTLMDSADEPLDVSALVDVSPITLPEENMQKRLLAIAVLLSINFAASLGLAANAPALVSQGKTAREAATITVVKAFAAAWNDPDKAAEYLSDKASVRMEEDKPALIGRKAFIDAVKPYIAQGEHFSVRHLEIFARGPVVVTHRIDTVSTPGKPDASYDIVGVFVVKDGKIIEWSDYLNK
jgi:limonene-1,2-epoxide hydrolase